MKVDIITENYHKTIKTDWSERDFRKMVEYLKKNKMKILLIGDIN